MIKVPAFAKKGGVPLAPATAVSPANPHGAADEIAIRQDPVLTALGKRPADALLLVAPLFDVHTRSWRENLEIAIKGRRIARTGPAGIYPGTAAQRIEKPGRTPIPGFGEVHKRIEEYVHFGVRRPSR